MFWFFFFFKQKTAYEMRISDWSSDVCSSDLQSGIGRVVPPRLGERAVEVFGEERKRALREVAEAVGKISIGPCYNRFGGEAAILPEADIAQQEIAQRVDAIGIGKCHRIDDIAGRFGHLLAAVEHEAMPEHLFWQRDPRRHHNTA